MLQLAQRLLLNPLLLFALVVGMAVTANLVASLFDRRRIQRFIESSGGRLVSCRWAPFAPGWLGSPYTRTYRVEHVDSEGSTQTAFMRTSAIAGVYTTGARIGTAQRRRKQTLLEAENEVLRRRVDDLEERLRARR